MQGRASIFCCAAGVATRMNLLSSDSVRVQVLLKPGGQQNLQQVLWKSRKEPGSTKLAASFVNEIFHVKGLVNTKLAASCVFGWKFCFP
jgi:hypothetical protein